MKRRYLVPAFALLVLSGCAAPPLHRDLRPGDLPPAFYVLTGEEEAPLGRVKDAMPSNWQEILSPADEMEAIELLVKNSAGYLVRVHVDGVTWDLRKKMGVSSALGFSKRGASFWGNLRCRVLYPKNSLGEMEVSYSKTWFHPDDYRVAYLNLVTRMLTILTSAVRPATPESLRASKRRVLLRKARVAMKAIRADRSAEQQQEVIRSAEQAAEQAVSRLEGDEDLLAKAKELRAAIAKMKIDILLRDLQEGSRPDGRLHFDYLDVLSREAPEDRRIEVQRAHGALFQAAASRVRKGLTKKRPQLAFAASVLSHLDKHYPHRTDEIEKLRSESRVASSASLQSAAALPDAQYREALALVREVQQVDPGNEKAKKLSKRLTTISLRMLVKERTSGTESALTNLMYWHALEPTRLEWNPNDLFGLASLFANGIEEKLKHRRDRAFVGRYFPEVLGKTPLQFNQFMQSEESRTFRENYEAKKREFFGRMFTLTFRVRLAQFQLPGDGGVFKATKTGYFAVRIGRATVFLKKFFGVWEIHDRFKSQTQGVKLSGLVPLGAHRRSTIEYHDQYLGLHVPGRIASGLENTGPHTIQICFQLSPKMDGDAIRARKAMLRIITGQPDAGSLPRNLNDYVAAHAWWSK